MNAPAPTLGVGVVWAERRDRVWLRVTGRDPARVLQGLLTNDVRQVNRVRAVCALVLTPKGRPVADVRLWPPRDGLWSIDVHTAARQALSDHLGRYVPPRLAQWRIDDDERLLAVAGPNAATLLRAMGVDPPPVEELDAIAESGDVAVVASDALGLPGYDVRLPAVRAREWVDRLRQVTAELDAETIERFQIAGGIPRYGAEWTERVLPAEVLEPTRATDRWISFQKGCYTGQEVVVRVAHRGHVNRWLRGLRAATTDAPAPGAEVHTESGKVVGWITRAAIAPWGGEVLALAMVRRELEPGTKLRIGEAEATLEPLPFPAWASWRRTAS